MSEIELGGDSAEVRDDAPEADVTLTNLELIAEEIAPEAAVAPAEEAPEADAEPAEPAAEADAEPPDDANEPAAEASAEPTDEPADLQSSLAAVVAGLDDGQAAAELVEQAEATDLAGSAATTSAEASAEALPGEDIVADTPDAAEDTTRRRVILPYAAYAAAWVLHAVASFVLLRGSRDPLSVAAYPALIFAGLALVVAAPAIVLWAWLTARSRTTQRSGLLTTALLLVSGLAALGVVGWWTVLLAVDAARGAL